MGAEPRGLAEAEVGAGMEAGNGFQVVSGRDPGMNPGKVDSSWGNCG